MTFHRTAVMTLAWVSLLGAQSTFKAVPTSLTFTYTAGSATLPASQNLVFSVTGATPVGFNVVVTNGPWLSVSPASGTTPVTSKVSANPTTLPLGTYSATITVTTTEPSPQQVTVPVMLQIKAPASTLNAAPNPVDFTYTRGLSTPAPAAVSLSTTGAVLSFTVTAAGGTWLSTDVKSGIVFPGFPSPVMVAVNPTGLLPGTYKGTLTIAASEAANKTQTVTVNLTVYPGLPTLTSVWPPQLVQGSPASTLTLQGTNFFTGSVVKAGTTTLSASIVGNNVITAVIPPALLAAAGTQTLTVSNPGTGGGDSNTQNLIVASTTPNIQAVVNAASYLGTAVAPGEIVTLFGTGMGPNSLASFVTPAPGARIATVLSNSRVLFDTTPAPIIYTMSGQVSVVVPYDVAGKTTVLVRAEYKGVPSSPVTMNVAASAPGIFTANSSGTGAAAAFNYDETTLAYSLNTQAAGVAKGGILIFYATGEGVPIPAALDGSIVTSASATNNPAVSVQVSGLDAQVLYVGGVPGLVSGLIQVNIRIPAAAVAGKALPLQLTVNGIVSTDLVTITVK